MVYVISVCNVCVVQRMAPASSYPLALAPIIPGAFSPMSSHISAEVLTGDSPMVYITTKDTPTSWRRADNSQYSEHQPDGAEDGSNKVTQTSTATTYWKSRLDHTRMRDDQQETMVDTHYLPRDTSYPSTNVSCISNSPSATMNHIAPGLHQTSLTLASPVLGCTGFLKKDFSTLTVEDHWRNSQLPFIRRRSVNVPIEYGRKEWVSPFFWARSNIIFEISLNGYCQYLC